MVVLHVQINQGHFSIISPSRYIYALRPQYIVAVKYIYVATISSRELSSLRSPLWQSMDRGCLGRPCSELKRN